MKPVIAMSGVSVSLGGKEILSKVSLEIAPTEFIGLLGANGAGKTTLLRAILGMIPLTHGTLSVFGANATPGNAAIGYMPQARSNLPETRLRGWDYVAATVNGHKLGLPLYAAALRRKVDHALALVGARALAKRPLTDLSGGEKQRLLLAQALVDEPKLLLLDEPLLNLDPGQQRNVVALVKHLQGELRIPVMFSSHEINPLMGAIDRVLYLGHGAAAIGTVDEVITGPVLSRLYNAPIEVHRVGGRVFVMSGSVEVERDAHRHDDHGHAGHHHA